MSRRGWVRDLRGPKRVSGARPAAVTHERERGPDGRVSDSSTVFLVGQECPFSCVFCDLWRGTLDEPTPEGSIPEQLARALGEIPHRSTLKLYNASNFFDPAAVPPADDERLLEQLRDFERVVVECHPSLVGARCRTWIDRFDGRLQVAMGLETVHPDVLPRLEKSMTLGAFERAVRDVLQWGGEVRAFVLLGVPYLAAGEQVDWCRRSVEHAVELGIGVVSVIPVRGGNGAMEKLATEGCWEPPTLTMLEDVLDRCAVGASVVQADLWDLDLLAECPRCFEARRQRLGEFNLTGRLGPGISCGLCRGESQR